MLWNKARTVWTRQLVWRITQSAEDKVESIVPESQMYSTEHVPKSDTEWSNIAPLTLYSGNLGGVQKRLGVSHGGRVV